MELHHSRHHAAYVKQANSIVEEMEELRTKKDFTRIAALEKSLSFNLSGHVLHSIFWKNLMPKGGGHPEGDLAHLLERDFGGFESFKSQMIEVASTIMGSGWAALVWEPIGQRLITCQIYDHQSNLSQAGISLMLIDAWEHAYYLQYENEKRQFFEAVWKLWNWKDITTRFEAARQRNPSEG